jgi:hypothetical protein
MVRRPVGLLQVAISGLAIGVVGSVSLGASAKDNVSSADIVARQDAEAARAIKQSQVVVWGRIVDGGSGSPGIVEVFAHRLFKGSLESPRLRVRIVRNLSREDREEVSAWFLVRRRDGLYEEVAPASLMADYYFMDVAARTERIPFPGMEPRRVADAIVVDLGVDSGLGRVSKTPPQAIRADHLMLVGQVTNFGPARPVLSASETSEINRGSPKIHLEIKDEAGRDAATPDPRFTCGNLSELGHFIDLNKGETLRFMVHFHYERLPPGVYSARLHYTVSREIKHLNVDGSFRLPDEATLARAKTLWEGTAVSEWITFRVASN